MIFTPRGRSATDPPQRRTHVRTASQGMQSKPRPTLPPTDEPGVESIDRQRLESIDRPRLESTDSGTTSSERMFNGSKDEEFRPKNPMPRAISLVGMGKSMSLDSAGSNSPGGSPAQLPGSLTSRVTWSAKKKKNSGEGHDSAKPLNYETVSEWSLSLQSLLSHPAGVGLFRNFLVETDNTSDLDFWLEVEAYRNTRDARAREEKAKNIIDYYLAPGLIRTNEDRRKSSQRTDWRVKSGTTQPEPDLFDPTQLKVFEYMEVENLDNFIGSKLYKDTLHGSIPIQAIELWGTSFEALRSNHVGTEVFEEFLKNEDSAVSIWKFWQAIQKFKRLKLPEPELHERADGLIAKYLASESDVRAALDQRDVDAVLAQLKKGAIANLFSRLEAPIYKVIVVDVFSKFNESKEYMGFLEHAKWLRKQKLMDAQGESEAHRGNGVGHHDSREALSYDEVRSWRISFNKLLNHPVGRRLIQLFVETEHSDDYYHFWLQCRQFSKMKYLVEMKAAADAIVVKYLLEDSDHEIGMDMKLKDDLVDRVEKADIAHDMFDKAKSQVYTTMERDSFPRYIMSPYYQYVSDATIPGEEVASWAKNFKRLLNHPDGNVLFTKFLRREHADENLEFYEAVQVFKNLQVDKFELGRRARLIFDKFIDPDSPSEISIDSMARREITEKMDSKLYSRVMFRSAEMQILKSIDNDSFSRFGTSLVYRNFKEYHDKLLTYDFTSTDMDYLKTIFEDQTIVIPQ